LLQCSNRASSLQKQANGRVSNHFAVEKSTNPKLGDDRGVSKAKARLQLPESLPDRPHCGGTPRLADGPDFHDGEWYFA
jgi:hypothetical protein